MNIIDIDKTDIYAIGDIHGEFKSISHWIKDNKLSNCAFIFCGDFGLGFDGEQKEHQDLLRAERACEEFNIECYVVRGNHDDPDYYNNPSKFINLKHFHLLPDYTIIKSPNHNILCVGGATSTDRSHRIKSYETEITQVMLRRHLSYESAKRKVKLYWWEKEPFFLDVEKINEILESGINIDSICSHAAPSECYPITSSRVIYWEGMDESLSKDLKEERDDLSKLLSMLKDGGMTITNWYYGHYHEHNTETINGTTFNLLDMGRNGRMDGGPGGHFDAKLLK